MPKQPEDTIKQKEQRLREAQLERLFTPSERLDAEIEKLQKDLDYFYFGIK